MYRKWINADRLSDEYRNGVKEFCEHVSKHVIDIRYISCPCQKCMNVKTVSGISRLFEHLMCHGIDRTYTVWKYHGELRGECSSSRIRPDFRYIHTMDTGSMGDIPTVDISSGETSSAETPYFDDENLREHPDMNERVREDAGVPLWPGCKKATKLSAVLTLFNLKAAHQMSDSFFTEMLEAVGGLLPDGNVLPRRSYDVKQMFKSIGLTHQKIHACPSDCILFRKEYAHLGECPKCGEKRYKKNKSPAKVMWYFPIIPRFKRMYSNAVHAKNLTWHHDNLVNDAMYRHPANSPQWHTIDGRYPEFGSEPRNLRLALSMGGMNLSGLQNTNHSTWPVILMIYNLPPWLCMERTYMMLSMIISGPKQPGNDIDVYLAPLIEDLKLLWDEGVEVYDGYRKENFRLKAMLYGTISDFPSYEDLSGYNVKGQTACPHCTEETDHLWLSNCKKSVYMGHRRWLVPSHRYRRMPEAFNGMVEERKAPSLFLGYGVFEKIQSIDTQYGKHFAKSVPTRGWKKQSIFFQLPYWKILYVRHSIDLMHIQKNICESLLNTLLADKLKSKDGYNARMDMVDLGMRAELAPVHVEGKVPYLPPAAHTLSGQERKLFLETLQSVKVPEGYSSNIQGLVSDDGLRLMNLKSHDYLVIMENFLPIAIRSILPNNVRITITKLCWFFKAMSSKVIDIEYLCALQRQIVETLCELEMYFPPSFFDIMVHLIVHLVSETRLSGPARMRWMYGPERYMEVLKGYVMNRHQTESCIAEHYLVEEAIEYWSEFIPNVDAIGHPVIRHTNMPDGESVTGGQPVRVTPEQLHRLHLCVLHNTVDVVPFVDLHRKLICKKFPKRDCNWIEVEHNRTFVDWFQDYVVQMLSKKKESVTEKVKWLSRVPDIHVYSHKCYLINGYTFYTREHDASSTMQNSGVSITTTKVNQLSTTYFGQIENIWELDYVGFREPVFDCHWARIPDGVQVEASGFIRVDLKKVGHKDDSYIMARKAQQIFYVTDPVDKRWSIVILPNKLSYQKGDHVEKDVYNIDNPFKNSTGNPYQDSAFPVPSLSDDGHHNFYQRLDHNDGQYINPDLVDIHAHERDKSSQKRKRRIEATKK